MKQVETLSHTEFANCRMNSILTSSLIVRTVFLHEEEAKEEKKNDFRFLDAPHNSI